MVAPVPELLRIPSVIAVAIAVGESWRLRPRWMRDDPRGLVGIGARLVVLLSIGWLAWLVHRAPDGKHFDDYCQWFLGVPMGAQIVLGALLAIGPGVIAYLAWRETPRPPAQLRWMLAGCALWTAIYAFLPVRLSAPDFDDFFVLAKFGGGVESNWHNDKPFFTAWDLPYRLTMVGDDALARFRINGWFALLYVILTGLWLERLLPALLDRETAQRAPRWLPWVAAIHLSPVVLANALHYELAAATWILAIGIALERARTAPCCPSAVSVLAWLALARTLQAYGDNSNAIAWVPVFLHGVLVARRWGSTSLLVGAVVILGSSWLDIGWREHRAIQTALRMEARQLIEVGVGGVLPLSIGVWWLWRSKSESMRARDFIARALSRPARAHVWLTYLAAGAAVYLLANKSNFGVPIPGAMHLLARMADVVIDGQVVVWTMASNHARYAGFFYPWLAALLLWLFLPRGRRGAVALIACAGLWNLSYIVQFYGDTRRLSAVETTYGRNTIMLQAAREALLRLEDAPAVGYLPIPRDHGDHYLVRAVDPQRRVLSACAPEASEHPEIPLLVTGHTLRVIAESRAPVPLRDSLATSLQPLDIQSFTFGDLEPNELNRWCEKVAPQNPSAIGGETCS